MVGIFYGEFSWIHSIIYRVVKLYTSFFYISFHFYSLFPFISFILSLLLQKMSFVRISFYIENEIFSATPAAGVTLFFLLHSTFLFFQFSVLFSSRTHKQLRHNDCNNPRPKVFPLNFLFFFVFYFPLAHNKNPEL